MRVLAIDPGSEQSAWVAYDGERVLDHVIWPNLQMLAVLPHLKVDGHLHVVIEQVTSYGMAVGAEVFETCVWTGRFMQAASGNAVVHRMPRREVKLHLCQSARAKDANLRQAILDRFGGEQAAKGRKAAPGPLYGIKADEWQALALAVTWWDLRSASAAVDVLTSVEEAVQV